MGWLIVLEMLPLVFSLVTAVEGIIKGVKQGQVKKDAVMQALQGVMQMMVRAGVLKDAEAAEALKVLGLVVDQVVAILNGLGVLKGAAGS